MKKKQKEGGQSEGMQRQRQETKQTYSRQTNGETWSKLDKVRHNTKRGKMWGVSWEERNR